MRLGALLAPERLLAHVRLDDRELGRVGEALARRALAAAGLRCVAQRLDTGAGEVDLLVRDGDVLACVEVKTGRSGPRFRPAQRVGRRRRERLARAARCVARRTGRPVRVDVVEVALDRRGRLAGIRHWRALEAHRAPWHEGSEGRALLERLPRPMR